jgi:hypothetical protein
MSAFVRGCDRIREVTGAHVLTLHHVGHGADARSRGSSVLEAAADVVMLAKRDAERLEIDCLKQKDAAEFAPLHFLAVPVGGSLALKPSGPTEGELNGQRRAILDVLHREYTAEQGASYTAWMEASGIAKTSFNKARTWLNGRGYVTAAGGRWRVTDSGRLALGALKSTAGAPGTSGLPSPEVHHEGGVYRHPSVDLDQYTIDREAA